MSIKMINLERTIKKSSKGFNNINSNEIRGGVNTVSEIVARDKNKELYSYGVIHQILPVGEKVRVSAYRLEKSDYTPEDFKHDTGHADIKRMFNTFGPGENSDTLFLPMFIPLINIDMTKDPIDLKTLLGKKVKLKMISENVATEAELISETPTDSLHRSGVRLKDLEEARNLNIPLNKFLISIGYDKELLEDFYTLKEEDFPESGILRFMDEAYWDKDVSGNKDFDIYIKEDKIPLGLIGRNYTQMKDKLCHMPLIMFSGK